MRFGIQKCSDILPSVFKSGRTIVSSLLIYRAKEILEKTGYTVTYNPFGNNKSPSLTAFEKA